MLHDVGLASIGQPTPTDIKITTGVAQRYLGRCSPAAFLFHGRDRSIGTFRHRQT